MPESQENGRAQRAPRRRGPTSITERQGRYQHIRNCLRASMSRAEILEQVVEKHNVSMKTAEKDYAEIGRQLEFDARRDIITIRSRRRMVGETILRSAMAAKDWRAANAANQTLCKIDGVYAPEVIKTEHSGGVAVAASVDISEVRSGDRRVRLMELLGKAEAERQRRGTPGNGHAPTNGHGGNGHSE